jgi:hypothetical protein
MNTYLLVAEPVNNIARRELIAQLERAVQGERSARRGRKAFADVSQIGTEAYTGYWAKRSSHDLQIDSEACETTLSAYCSKQLTMIGFPSLRSAAMRILPGRTNAHKPMSRGSVPSSVVVVPLAGAIIAAVATVFAALVG